MKEKAGYGGGFRIQGDMLEREQHVGFGEEEENEDRLTQEEKEQMTKDEIFKKMNLSMGDGAVGKG